MDWTAQFFIYCERGLDPSFWAEPFNALSNASFIIAGLAALSLRRIAVPSTVTDILIALTLAIGAGSFLFHTFATRWAVVADTLPITLFMLTYIFFALRFFLNVSVWLIAAALTLFISSAWFGTGFNCPTGLLPITEAAGRRCLNGSAAYLPALVSLAILSVALAIKRHPALPLIAVATAVLTASITLRTLDIEVCAMTDILGRARGTHALWHILNGLLLYLLLVAALKHRQPASGVN